MGSAKRCHPFFCCFNFVRHQVQLLLPTRDYGVPFLGGGLLQRAGCRAREGQSQFGTGLYLPSIKSTTHHKHTESPFAIFRGQYCRVFVKGLCRLCFSSSSNSVPTSVCFYRSTRIDENRVRPESRLTFVPNRSVCLGEAFLLPSCNCVRLSPRGLGSPQSASGARETPSVLLRGCAFLVREGGRSACEVLALFACKFRAHRWCCIT